MKRDNPETPSELSPRNATFWLSEIEAAQSRNENWYLKAEEADERYRDCEEDSDESRGFGGLNVYWANVETQKAAIGEDFGKPQVTRVNMPENDGGLARHVATVWERAIEASVKESDDNHDIALAVWDVLQPGKGQVWIDIEADDKKWVTATICRVCHKDYLEGAATRWGSVPWVARRHFFTRDELVDECKMTKEKAEKVSLSVTLPYKSKSDSSDAKGQEQFKRAEVWEIWSRFPEKARVFVAVGHKDDVLRYDKDPLHLKKFFPCPRPMQANGDESRPPLTDYSRYQDQAEELDRISERIFVLTETLRRVGVHDKAFKELSDIAEAEENTTIAVENWVELQAKGGLTKVQEWQDILPIAQVLAELHQQRDTLLKLIYELSGISDLARGHTDPDETLGAQKLKQSFGSSRFKRREKESRRFASEAYQIKGEVIAEFFPREQLEQMSGVDLPLRADIDKAKAQLTEVMRGEQARQMLEQLKQARQQPPQEGQPAPQMPDPQAMATLIQAAQVPMLPPEQMQKLTKLAHTKFSWEDVRDVLRSDVRRCYAVEVETDQTAFVDEEADKKNRTEFFGTVMQSMQQVGPMIAGNPKAGEIWKQMIMFVVSAFKAGRGLEEGIEQAIDNAIEMAAQNQGQQQDPKAMADAQAAQAKLEAAKISVQRETIKLKQIEAQAGADAQTKIVDQQLRIQESEAKQREAQAKSIESHNKLVQQEQATQQKAVEGQQKVAQQHMANEAKATGHRIDMQNKVEQLQFERTERATAREEILKDNHVADEQRKTKAQSASNGASK